MKENGIKMFDKHGSVLRIETVINHPYEFKGRVVVGWFPMSKGVANLYRYAEVSRAANSRYLEALSPVGDPARAQHHLHKLATAISHNGRSYRGFNPAARKDVDLFAAVMRGEHTIMGFRNRDILRQLFTKIKDQTTLLRLSATVSRLLKLLHVHQLIAKIPRSRRWRVTLKGQSIMAMVLKIHHENYPRLLMNQTA